MEQNSTTQFLTRHANNLASKGSPQGHSRIKNVHNFLKRTLIKFLESSDLEWVDPLPFVYYHYNIFPSSNGTDLPVFSHVWP